MKINIEETLRRMEAATPSEEEFAGMEAVDLTDLDDADLILVYGTLLRARRDDRELDLSDYEAEIMRRADEGLTANLGEVRKTRAALKQQIPSAKE